MTPFYLWRSSQALEWWELLLWGETRGTSLSRKTLGPKCLLNFGLINSLQGGIHNNRPHSSLLLDFGSMNSFGVLGRTQCSGSVFLNLIHNIKDLFHSFTPQVFENSMFLIKISWCTFSFCRVRCVHCLIFPFILCRCFQNGTWSNTHSCIPETKEGGEAFPASNFHKMSYIWKKECCTLLTMSMIQNDFDFLHKYNSFLGVWYQVMFSSLFFILKQL